MDQLREVGTTNRSRRFVLVMLVSSLTLLLALGLIYIMLDTSLAAANRSTTAANVSNAQLATATQDPRPGFAAATREAVLNELIADANTRATIEAAFAAERNAIIEATIIAITPTPVPLVMPENPFLGQEDAPITIVEFSDYNCPYCTRFDRTTRDPLLAHYGDLIRFVFRDYPIVGGDASVLAAVAARCANLQDKFWEFGELIFANNYLSPEQGRRFIDETLIIEYATALEMDIDAFNQCRNDGSGLEQVIFDYEAARALEVRGVPAFYINGELISGAQPLENFMAVIDAQLIAQGITPPAR